MRERRGGSMVAYVFVCVCVFALAQSARRGLLGSAFMILTREVNVKACCPQVEF